MKRICFTLLIVLFTSAMEPTPVALLMKPPGTPEVFYWPGMWAPEQPLGRFQLGYWHQDCFNVSWTVQNSEPEPGYPYHFGTIVGINDTVKVTAYFDNRSASDFVVSSQCPESWFFPVLFDPSEDVFISQPLADTSVFSYRFEHWINMEDGMITNKPDTILSRAIHVPTYPKGLVFSIWGVNAGSFRVILKPTSSLPTGIRLVVDNPNSVFTMATGQHSLDTLNAFLMIAGNALLRREFTLFNTYINNAFTMNPNSLPGWALRYSSNLFQADTTNAISAIDSLLYIGNNNLDTFIPDTSARTIYNDAWLNDYLHNYPFARWRLLYPDYAKYIIFL